MRANAWVLTHKAPTYMQTHIILMVCLAYGKVWTQNSAIYVNMHRHSSCLVISDRQWCGCFFMASCTLWNIYSNFRSKRLILHHPPAPEINTKHNEQPGLVIFYPFCGKSHLMTVLCCVFGEIKKTDTRINLNVHLVIFLEMVLYKFCLQTYE